VNLLAQDNRFRSNRAQASALAAFALLLMLGQGISSLAIEPTSTEADLQPFVGIWHAKFKGKTFLTIKLEKQQSRLSGTTSHTQIELDKDGELLSAEEHEGRDPIVDAKLVSGTLRITTKDEESQDTIQCEITLTGTDQAELRILTPPDVPAPKPWKLERAKAGQ
jgi:hypothetical protein